MGALNHDFQYPKSFRLFIAIVFILFLAFFVFTITSVIGVFESEMYSTAVASLNNINY